MNLVLVLVKMKIAIWLITCIKYIKNVIVKKTFFDSCLNLSNFFRSFSFIRYCLADDQLLDAVKFLDLGDGAGWELLQVDTLFRSWWLLTKTNLTIIIQSQVNNPSWKTDNFITKWSIYVLIACSFRSLKCICFLIITWNIFLVLSSVLNVVFSCCVGNAKSWLPETANCRGYSQSSIHDWGLSLSFIRNQINTSCLVNW